MDKKQSSQTQNNLHAIQTVGKHRLIEFFKLLARDYQKSEIDPEHWPFELYSLHQHLEKGKSLEEFFESPEIFTDVYGTFVTAEKISKNKYSVGLGYSGGTVGGLTEWEVCFEGNAVLEIKHITSAIF